MYRIRISPSIPIPPLDALSPPDAPHAQGHPPLLDRGRRAQVRWPDRGSTNAGVLRRPLVSGLRRGGGPLTVVPRLACLLGALLSDDGEAGARGHACADARGRGGAVGQGDPGDRGHRGPLGRAERAAEAVHPEGGGLADRSLGCLRGLWGLGGLWGLRGLGGRGRLGESVGGAAAATTTAVLAGRGMKLICFALG